MTPQNTPIVDGPQSFLVLHGIANHRPPEHWQFWVSSQLAAAGHQVLYPGLPDPDAPSYDAWATALVDQLCQLRHFRRTVICHSLACLLWLSLATDIERELRPTRLLLVSPPDPSCVPPSGGEFIRPFSSAAVADSVTDELRVVCSDNDPYNPVGAARMYAEPLKCPVDVLEGAGHIAPDSGYGAWPSLESWCLGRLPRCESAPRLNRHG